MNVNLKKLLYIALWIALPLFALRHALFPLTDAYSVFGAAGEVVAFTVVLVGFYERFLWKWNPLEKTPLIKGSYEVVISHNYKGKAGKKKATATIKQSLFFVSVSITTNEITSSTIVAHIGVENGEPVLYYTYITNPQSRVSEGNPIQYGSCRLTLTDDKGLRGKYWTSEKNNGDIVFKRSKK